MLWHGTRGTDPKEITELEDGFDMRFASTGGIYGTGNYFAVLSSYSRRGYSHRRADGNRELILASVLVGRHALKVDENRRMPPKIANSALRYDSVAGHHQMFVVYSNTKAYPMYRVIYQ